MEVRAGRWGNGGEVGREDHRIEGWYNMMGETSSLVGTWRGKRRGLCDVTMFDNPKAKPDE